MLDQVLNTHVLSVANYQLQLVNTSIYQQNLSNPSFYQQDVITESLINSWLIVGKLGQGMRCCKCINNAIYIGVCAARDIVTDLVSLILFASI